VHGRRFLYHEREEAVGARNGQVKHGMGSGKRRNLQTAGDRPA
jgi:hypothetical protein